MAISDTAIIEKTAENTRFNFFEYGKKIRPLNKKIISNPEKIILWDLSDRFGKNGKIYPSNHQISNSTGLPYKTVINCLSDLKSKKFINYDAQYNRNRRYIDLYDPELAAKNFIVKNDEWGSLLVPKLSLVRDSGIPGQGHSYNRTQQEKRTTTPKPPLRIVKTTSPEKSDIVVELKNRIKSDSLKNDFNPKTYSSLKNLDLTDGQIKTLIDMMNVSVAKSCGWMIWKVNDIGKDSIDDFEVIIEKQKQKLRDTIKEQKKAEQEWNDFEPISQEEMKRMTNERRQKADIKKRQSLKTTTSDQTPPFNPQKKEQVIKEEISIDENDPIESDDFVDENYSIYDCSNMDCEPIEITQKRFEQIKEMQRP